MAYGNFMSLTRRTFADKVLCDIVFNVTKNQKYEGYERGPASMVYKCFDKKSSGSDIKNKSILIKN